jgi:hypothetical protein
MACTLLQLLNRLDLVEAHRFSLRECTDPIGLINLRYANNRVHSIRRKCRELRHTDKGFDNMCKHIPRLCDSLFKLSGDMPETVTLMDSTVVFDIAMKNKGELCVILRILHRRGSHFVYKHDLLQKYTPQTTFRDDIERDTYYTEYIRNILFTYNVFRVCGLYWIHPTRNNNICKAFKHILSQLLDNYYNIVRLQNTESFLKNISMLHTGHRTFHHKQDPTASTELFRFVMDNYGWNHTDSGALVSFHNVCNSFDLPSFLRLAKIAISQRPKQVYMYRFIYNSLFQRFDVSDLPNLIAKLDQLEHTDYESIPIIYLLATGRSKKHLETVSDHIIKLILSKHFKAGDVLFTNHIALETALTIYEDFLGSEQKSFILFGNSLHQAYTSLGHFTDVRCISPVYGTLFSQFIKDGKNILAISDLRTDYNSEEYYRISDTR